MWCLVILAGGAINSPQLLQLSGVGNPALLEPLGVPVVAISGYGREVVADVLAGVAVFGLLTKPVPPPLLVATVRRAIEAAGDAAPAP